MIEVTLKSKRKVKIKNLTVDQIDECKDTPEIVFLQDGTQTIKNVNKAKTAWLRFGIGGGYFTDREGNPLEVNGYVHDDVILQLSDKEVDELVTAIQNNQFIKKKKD